MTFPFSRKRTGPMEPAVDYEFNNLIQNLNNSHMIASTANVLDFGAKGDGTTDDSAAILAALTYLHNNTLTKGGVLYFPTGKYKFSISMNGGDFISIVGDYLGTIFLPIDSTSFILNYYPMSFTGYHHFISNVQFVGTGAKVGRGVYVNNAGYMVLDKVRFDNLEYGYYSNSSEWCSFRNCFFTGNSTGFFSTTLTSDILGNAPTVAQNSAEQYFVQSQFWANTLGFYSDNKNWGGSDQVSSNYFIECDLLNNTAAIAFGSAGANYFPSLYLNSVWFENNTATGTQSTNGFTINNGDLYINNGALDIVNTMFTSKLSLKGTCHVSGYDVKFNNTSFDIDGTTTINLDHVTADANGGTVLDRMECRNAQPFTSDRPILTRVPLRTAFSLGNYNNKITTGTSTCAFGTLPATNAGAPVKGFVTGDGFYANTCVSVAGVNGDSVKWSVGTTSGKYYVTTVSMKSLSGNIAVTIGSGGSIIWPSGTVNLGVDWITYGCLGLSANTTTATLQFFLTGNHTVYFSCIQCVEFSNLNDAVNFFDSNNYSVLLVESQANTANSPVNTLTNFPTSGQYGDLTNITLLPGTWLISATLRAFNNGSTTTSCEVGISTTSGNFATGLVAGDNDLVFLPPNANSESSCSIPSYKVSPTANTTYYLKYLANYSAGTPQARGRISAVQLFL